MQQYSEIQLLELSLKRGLTIVAPIIKKKTIQTK